MKNLSERLRAALARIDKSDSKLSAELNDLRRSVDETAAARIVNESAVEATSARAAVAAASAGGNVIEQQRMVAETIVLRIGRPVLAIRNDEAQLDFREAESEIWRQRLLDARAHLVAAARAVGRIELRGHPGFSWVGTGWLVAPDVIVTNRHVAGEFGRRDRDRYIFKIGLGNQRMGASIDFLEEFGRNESIDFSLKEILHIEDEAGPDLAFLRVEPAGEHLATPIHFATTPAEENQQVAVIGYPARDSRIPDQALMEDIFGDVYDKKRLAPGQILPSSDDDLQHDCSTLGGNSGSVVLDLQTGHAVGLHFAGRFLKANYAVRAQVVADRLAEIRSGRSPRAAGRTRAAEPRMDQVAVVVPAANVDGNGAIAGTRLTFTLPIHVSIDVGSPIPSPSRAGAVTIGDAMVMPGTDRIGEDDEVEITSEAVPADYKDREGYRATFLGPEVPLPVIVRNQKDVLVFQLDGRPETELRYRHYSVKMNARRRLCIFSAVNIDGKSSRRTKRRGWRTDPRIPAGMQILKECYGDPPKFSRGHMTRREDPAWGDAAEADLGNVDSMHVTNTVPQMQPFNAGIWLGLEDYALQNAREDDMRISVFTGPFLKPDDSEVEGVQIPVSFWKIIAFIHDKTGRLCATGYTMSQAAFLREEEFVFGQHKTSQVSISSIEDEAGLSFGRLADLDPFERTTEARPSLLTDPRQIRFIR